MEAVVDAESFSFFLRRWNESARTLKPNAMLLLLLFFLFRLNVLTTLNVLNLCILLGVLEYCQLKVLQCLTITLQLLHLYLHLRLPLCYCLKWCFLNIILGLDLFEDRCSSHPLVSFIFILLPLFNPEIKVNFFLTFFLANLVQLLFTFFLANLVQLLNWNLLKEFFFFSALPSILLFGKLSSDLICLDLIPCKLYCWPAVFLDSLKDSMNFEDSLELSLDLCWNPCSDCRDLPWITSRLNLFASSSSAYFLCTMWLKMIEAFSAKALSFWSASSFTRFSFAI